MARVSLLSRFASVKDSRPVPDPWGYGIVFEIGRAGREAQVANARKRILANPIQVAKFEAGAKAGAMAAAGVAEEGAAFKDMMQKAIDGMAFPAAELLADGTADAVAAVLDDYLLGWSGMTDAETGAEVPFSREAAAELLTAQEWVPAGMPYSGTTLPLVPKGGDVAAARKAWQDGGQVGDGQPLGAALRQFIFYEANQGERYRSSYVEAAAKNSVPSSAGG
jgi:hypothetical protein